MSTTEAKRDVIDFLWDWAEGTGNWTKLLVNKVVSKEDALVEDDRKEIYKAFPHDIGLMTEKETIPEITRPKFSTSVQVEGVKSLSLTMNIKNNPPVEPVIVMLSREEECVSWQ